MDLSKFVGGTDSKCYKSLKTDKNKIIFFVKVRTLLNAYDLKILNQKQFLLLRIRVKHKHLKINFVTPVKLNTEFDCYCAKGYILLLESNET